MISFHHIMSSFSCLNSPSFSSLVNFHHCYPHVSLRFLIFYTCFPHFPETSYVSLRFHINFSQISKISSGFPILFRHFPSAHFQTPSTGARRLGDVFPLLGLRPWLRRGCSEAVGGESWVPGWKPRVFFLYRNHADIWTMDGLYFLECSDCYTYIHIHIYIYIYIYTYTYTYIHIYI